MVKIETWSCSSDVGGRKRSSGAIGDNARRSSKEQQQLGRGKKKINE